MFVEQLEAKLEAMFHAWEEEPAYRIWQVLAAEATPANFALFGRTVWGIGKYWAEKEKCRSLFRSIMR